METKIAILTPFFENPAESFHIREVAKRTGISHTAVRKHLAALYGEGYLLIKKEKPYNAYKANASSKKFCNLKLYYNLEKLRESGLIEQLERRYDYPCIVLFGSYAKAYDDEKSDIDICLISEVKKETDVKNYQKILHRPVSMHLFDARQWEEAKKKNPDLINSICNGIVLSGQLEVV